MRGTFFSQWLTNYELLCLWVCGCLRHPAYLPTNGYAQPPLNLNENAAPRDPPILAPSKGRRTPRSLLFAVKNEIPSGISILTEGKHYFKLCLNSWLLATSPVRSTGFLNDVGIWVSGSRRCCVARVINFFHGVQSWHCSVHHGNHPLAVTFVSFCIKSKNDDGPDLASSAFRAWVPFETKPGFTLHTAYC